jgi:hypothetical protein
MGIAHHLILVSLTITLLSMSLMLRSDAIDLRQSLSGHAAIKRRKNYVPYASGLIIAGILFYVFTIKWLAPTLHLGTLFDLLVILTVLCELVAVFVPDHVGAKRQVHRTSAWLMALGMLISVIILLFAAPDWSAKILVGMFLSYMILGVSLFLFVASSHRYFLFFQSTYILSFYIAVLATAYAR